MSAAINDQVAIIRELLKAGADPNLKGCGSFPLVQTFHLECVTELLKGGADVNLRDSDSKNALLRCIAVTSKDLLQTYIQAGIDVNAATAEGHTALMMLTHEPRIELAELLIAAGADVNAGRKWGKSWQSVLDYFVSDYGGSASRRVRRKELVEFLRSKGAKTAQELGR